MKNSHVASRKIALCAMLMALAMIFSYVEALIPINFGVPGIKLGIANLIVVIGLFFLPPAEVLMISIARILLMGYLFGNGMSILYSLAGGLLSFFVMLLLKKIKGFSMTGVSIAGAVAHNVAQICVAAYVVQNTKLLLSSGSADRRCHNRNADWNSFRPDFFGNPFRRKEEYVVGFTEKEENRVPVEKHYMEQE